MNILENNVDILARLYEQFPESFNGLRMDGEYLVYGKERTNISQFNIDRLLKENSSFTASLSVLSAEDIFKIIRLHAEMITSKLELDAKVDENGNERIQEIKDENPLMKNINVVSRVKDGFKEEFITIVDSQGVTHTFKNDYKTNIFAIYENLKYSHLGRDITPDEFINEINRKMYEIKMEEASRFENRDDVSEDFENKMNKVNDPYKDNKMYRVLGNQDNDIAIVQDLQDGTNSNVITFDNNQYGDLVVERHSQYGDGSGNGTGYNEYNQLSGTVDEENIQVNSVNNYQVVARLISTQEFYNLLDSNEELTEDQRKSVDLYYAYLGDLIMYEDFLLDELKAILNSFRAYVIGLESSISDEAVDSINSKQQEAIDKNTELELKKNEGTNSVSYEKAQENVKRLVLTNPNNNLDNAAYASIVQVIAFVVGIAIILTAITLFLLG